MQAICGRPLMCRHHGASYAPIRLHCTVSPSAALDTAAPRRTCHVPCVAPQCALCRQHVLYAEPCCAMLRCAAPQVAFIDEIFKANSAILNALLTLLNERLFDNGSERLPVPLLCLVRAGLRRPF